MKTKLSTIFFISLLGLFIYLTGLIVWPYISYIIVGLLLSYVLRPAYLVINNKVKRPWFSSLVLILIVFFIFFVPLTVLTSSLARQSYSALNNLDLTVLDDFSARINDYFHVQVDLAYQLERAINSLKQFLVKNSIALISSIADFVVGMIIMFFVMFYSFKDGRELYELIYEAIPLKNSHKKVLFDELQVVTNAVIVGQLLTSIIQGAIGGIGFFIFGIPNPVFWGFIMAILSFMPVVGTPMVFVPAGLLELINKDYFSGLGILIYGFVLIMNIDNIIKPFIISEKSQLNAALILIGVLGGLKTFGFIGFILGPLIIAMLLAMIKVYKQDFRPSQEVEELRKKGQEFLIIPLKKRPKDKHRKKVPKD